MSKLTSIVSIQDLLIRWRRLGYRRLSTGIELLGSVPGEEQDTRMHAVFPGLTAQEHRAMEDQLRQPIPAGLRAFFRGCGGMSLFGCLFTFYGLPRIAADSDGVSSVDLISFHQSMAWSSWAQPGMLAFASSASDQSVFVAGMGDTDDEILRLDRDTGHVPERHEEVFACVETRLYRMGGVVEILAS